MSNEMAKARLADLMDTVRTGIESIARTQQEQARLTATATAAGKRVTVTVNAQGVVVEVRFSDDVADLTYPEIARAVTAATQTAAAEVQRRTREMLDRLRADQSQMPRLSEFLGGIPDVLDLMPSPPEVSTAPPKAHARTETGDGSTTFADVERWEHGSDSATSPVADKSW
ncbi:YbaB/EbfC family nucleoid-associated protein [Nocardia sp. alder85J]|uniref:YbaB/EbfC family nucleoid-associated protein n=1 Tax=Nocardia sp. alder85J TaxID=2862949 RepID=UPI001CD3E2A5|nr:YbaB/EbfC family nucleoid-associated protein [Nocardia sp. alder85J]MCX4093043.1 YbaB/EbfC family nucleoid-associated protein [Nocardia sp. alder85J]